MGNRTFARELYGAAQARLEANPRGHSLGAGTLGEGIALRPAKPKSACRGQHLEYALLRDL